MIAATNASARPAGGPPPAGRWADELGDAQVAAPNSGAGVSDRRRFWLRVLFALDVIGAGGPGVLMLAAPGLAGKRLFDGPIASDGAVPVLGCIWVALGLLSVAGLFRPVAFSPVLIVQFAYKLIWLAAVGLPAALAGRGVPPVLTAIFFGWVIAVGFAAPWRALFAADAGSNLPTRKPR